MPTARDAVGLQCQFPSQNVVLMTQNRRVRDDLNVNSEGYDGPTLRSPRTSSNPPGKSEEPKH